MSADSSVEAPVAATRAPAHPAEVPPSAAPFGPLALGRLAVLVAASTLAMAASAEDLPARKAGLWEQRMSSPEGGSPPTVIQQCTDAAAEKAFRDMATGMSQQACTRNETRRDGPRWLTESVCSMGSIKITSKAVMTGNFDSAYRMEVDSQYEPALMGRSASRSVIDARWLGPCKADQRPGDMILSDGKKMNVLQMQKPGR